LLGPQAPYTRGDVVWDAGNQVFNNMLARGLVSPHLPPGTSPAERGAIRAAAAAAVPEVVVPLEMELKLRCVCVCVLSLSGFRVRVFSLWVSVGACMELVWNSLGALCPCVEA
jgi:hypothetical protein